MSVAQMILDLPLLLPAHAQSSELSRASAMLTQANLYSTPEVLFRDPLPYFFPAFRERRRRQVWIRPRRSLWLCQFLRDLPAEHCFFPSARRLRSQPKRSCPGRCPERTSWRFQFHEDILTGPTSLP